jgi:hypothetical protein
MIDFIKKFLSNILSECSNIPVFLEELKLNNQELFNKSVFLRLFDPAQPFANDRMSD